VVQAGAERDGWIEIRAGVQAGDKLVVEGSLHLLKYFKPQLAAKQASK
jgi:cobalt-zinc-cadmium efflux system membrane fusion protein